MALPKDKDKPRVYRKKKGFKTVDGKRVPIYGKPELVFPAKQPGFPHQAQRAGSVGKEKYYPLLPNTSYNPTGNRGEIPASEARQILDDAQRKRHPRNKGFWDIEEINKILQKTNSGKIDTMKYGHGKWHEGPRPTRRSGGESIPRNEPMNPFLAGKGDRALKKYYPKGERRGAGLLGKWFSDEPLRRGPRGTKPGTRMSKEAWERKRKQWQMDMEDEERRQELMNQPRNPRKKGVGFG